MSLAPVANEQKNFNQKSSNYLVWTGHLWVVEFSLYASLILFPLFATNVTDTGGKFITGVIDGSGNLPPVFLIPVRGGTPGLVNFLEKFEMINNFIIKGLGEDASYKNLKQKI